MLVDILKLKTRADLDTVLEKAVSETTWYRQCHDTRTGQWWTSVYTDEAVAKAPESHSACGYSYYSGCGKSYKIKSSHFTAMVPRNEVIGRWEHRHTSVYSHYSVEIPD